MPQNATIAYYRVYGEEGDSQLLEPATITVRFYSYMTHGLYVPSHDIRTILRDPERLEQVSIFVPVGDSPEIQELGKILQCQTMSAMEIPEDIHPEITAKIASVSRTRHSNGYFTSIKVEMVIWRLVEYDFHEYLTFLREEMAVMINSRASPKPATKSSIEALERFVVRDDNSVSETTCSVCLEVIEVGAEATRLPCRHFYHQECIVNWLRVSHFCPLCRHELPAES